MYLHNKVNAVQFIKEEIINDHNNKIIDEYYNIRLLSSLQIILSIILYIYILYYINAIIK